MAQTNYRAGSEQLLRRWQESLCVRSALLLGHKWISSPSDYNRRPSSSPSFLFSHSVYQWHLYRFCLWEKSSTVQFVQLVAATEASSWTEQIFEKVRRSEMLHNSYVLHTATTNELLLQVLIHHPCKLSKCQTFFIFPSLLKKAHMCCIQLMWPLTLIMPDCQWLTKRTQAVKPVKKKNNDTEILHWWRRKGSSSIS